MNTSLFPDFFDKAKLKAQKSLKDQEKNAVFGSKYIANAIKTGKYGFPKLKPFHGKIPQYYISFSECTEIGNPLVCVTFFEYDNKLEKLWVNADNYIPILHRYQCVTEPDYSLKIGMPMATQITNSYRNRALGFYFQEHGLSVIPSMCWSNTPSYDFCFDGYSRGGTVIVSSLGVLKNKLSTFYFRLGFIEMLKRVSPDSVIILGEVNDTIKDVIPSQLDVHFFLSERYKRFRAYGK